MDKFNIKIFHFLFIFQAVIFSHSTCFTEETIKERPKTPKYTYRIYHKDIPKIYKKTCLQTKKYTCELCKKRFISTNLLNIHIKQIHKIDFIYKCHLCKHKTNRKDHSETHLKTHSKSIIYRCDKCIYACKDYDKFLEHKLNNHQNFICSLCKFTTHQKNAFDLHQKTHNKKNTYECYLCFYTTDKKEKFNRHVTSCQNKAIIYKCPYCPIRSGSSNILNAHKRKCEKEFMGLQAKFDYIPNENDLIIYSETELKNSNQENYFLSVPQELNFDQ